jgi:hypothetical protein
MNLGELSHLIVWGATAAYAIALVAFSMDLARLADEATARRRAGAGAPAVAGVGATTGAAPTGTS